jgi:hypothetical protein
MASPLKQHPAFVICLLMAFIACSGSAARSQDNLLVPSPSAPPPLKFISGNERAQLSAARDAKGRLKAGMEMAQLRLLRAEQFTIDQRFTWATIELGIYQALIEDLLRFLGGQKSDSNKTRDFYRLLEIELRKHGMRLEAIRRVTPTEYAIHVKAIAEFADDARTDALNSFFNGTVIEQDLNNSSAKENSAGASPPQPKKQP